MIKLKTYNITNQLLTNELLVTYIDTFWQEIFNEIKDTSHLLLMCKVQFTDIEMGYRTLGHLTKVNYEDKYKYLDLILNKLSVLNDSYITHPISKITFSYLIKAGQCLDSERILLKNNEDKSLTFHNFNNLNLPISMNPSDYGKIIVENYRVTVDEVNYNRFIVEDNRKSYQIDVSLDGIVNKIKILGNYDLEWTDTLIRESDLIMREIKKSTIYFMDGEVILRKQQLPAKPFRRLVKESKLVNDFYTFDIETIKLDNKITPYLICAYDGQEYITSYGKDQKQLFKSFIDQLLLKIEPGITYIYAHNLSGFDGIFLLKHLLEYGLVEPLLFNGKLITIKLKVKTDNKSETKTIVFKDSYLLLPLSLRKLCKAFKIPIPKGYFPFLLTNIYYTGIVPKFEHWTGISISDYESLVSAYKNRMWSFKEESIKYCKLDCKTLHEILEKFNELIFSEFSININKPLTLPSLAMRIYKTHYMPEDLLYQMLGRPERNIRESYSGGAVDVYIPHNIESSLLDKVNLFFKKLYYYDVNSLYPYIMAFSNMPVGKPIAFDGDIRKLDYNAFGYFYCKITSPDNLDHPILQRRIKTPNGLRTIAGLGTWEGWIFSEEMDNAINYGYQFEIIKGYQFEKGNIFKDYVVKMYELRKQYEKTDAMNLIAKLLMNSLYGKFGMKLTSTEIAIYNSTTDEGREQLKYDLELYGESIQDYIQLEDHLLIIRNTIMSCKYNEKEDMYHGQDINIAIASAITAGARLHMSYFKNKPDFN